MKQSSIAAVLCLLFLSCPYAFCSERATDQAETAEIPVDQKVAVLVSKAAKLMTLARVEAKKSEHELAITTCKQAIESCDEALNLAPENDVAIEKRAKLFVLCGMEQEQMLQHDAAIASCRQAIRAFERVLAKDHDNIRAYMSKGLALEVVAKAQEMMSRLTDALESHSMSVLCMDRVLEKAPNSTAAYICKGNAFMARGLLQKQEESKAAIESYSEAIEAFDRAIKSDPETAMAYQDKAEALRQRAISQEEIGQHNEAIDGIKVSISSYDQAISHTKEQGDLARARQSAANFLKALEVGNVLSRDEIKRRLQSDQH